MGILGKLRQLTRKKGPTLPVTRWYEIQCEAKISAQELTVLHATLVDCVSTLELPAITQQPEFEQHKAKVLDLLGGSATHIASQQGADELQAQANAELVLGFFKPLEQISTMQTEYQIPFAASLVFADILKGAVHAPLSSEF